MQDVAVILAGFRAAAADIAWVQLLQSTSGPDLLDDAAGGSFPSLKRDTLRVVRIDPFFHRAYLFGAGILAWFRNVNRPGEALELLEEGTRRNPSYWAFRLYAAAIAYNQKDEFGKAAHLLEDAIREPDCPALVKAILANTYKALGAFPRAVEIWEEVLDDPEALDYHPRARSEIRALKLLSGKP